MKSFQVDSAGKLIDETGDAFVYQVVNNNEEDVYISVLLYQFDGAIRMLYPKVHY